MLWTNRSEYKLTGWFRRAAVTWLPVFIEATWHTAQPTLVNNVLPFLMDAEQSVANEHAGAGAARNRM